VSSKKITKNIVLAVFHGYDTAGRETMAFIQLFN
jgi:hypothetical protein